MKTLDGLGMGLNSELPPLPARSALMAKVRVRDTAPELAVRSAAHALGFRYRLHRQDLPGTPDIVFPGRHKIIFVHGCFWHQHPKCSKASIPKTRVKFWQDKLGANVVRDRRNKQALKAAGWEVLTVWECESRDEDGLRSALRTFLDGQMPSQ